MNKNLVFSLINYLSGIKKICKKLVEKAIENEYKNVRFSYDLMGYPNKINISVYYGMWNYQHGKLMFQVDALKENGAWSDTYKIRVTKILKKIMDRSSNDLKPIKCYNKRKM